MAALIHDSFPGPMNPDGSSIEVHDPHIHSVGQADPDERGPKRK